jgi:hypothetical protein
MEGKHTFESKARKTDQSERTIKRHMDQKAHQSEHNPSDKHPANHEHAQELNDPHDNLNTPQE